jgi:pimeloyl-ACP methyl ester carboxylesterase
VIENAAKLWFDLVNNRGPLAFDVQPEGLRHMWLDNFGRRRPIALSPQPLTCEKLSAITTQRLAIQAEFGMPYSRKIGDRLAQCIPSCRMVTVPGVTHFMSCEEPVVFNQIVLDFLAQH